MLTTRRHFLRTATLVTAFPGLVVAAGRNDRLPLAFSTLGCPRWDWRTILDRAHQWGYAAIELRGIQGETNLPKRPEFSDAQLATSLKELAALDLRISDLGSSVLLHEADPAKRAAQLDDGRRFIDLAARLQAPFIRVFGDKFVAGQPKAATVDRVVGGLEELGRHAKGSSVGVLIESHGDFTESPVLREILDRVNLPNVGLLWDAHHTVVAGKEKPADTWRQVGRYVRHVHLKDSRPEGDGVRYVLTGAGTVPVLATVRVLMAAGYRGYYCLEWEKLWHPEIEEPEVAFPQFARVMRDYLRLGADPSGA